MLRKYLVCIMLFILPSCYFFRGKSQMQLPKINSIEMVKKQFPTTVQEIALRVSQAKQEAEAGLGAFYKVPAGKRNFENTIKAFDDISARFSNASAPLAILEMVSPSKDIRDAARSGVLDLANFSVDHFAQNIKIYEAYTDFVNTNDLSLLNPEERYTVEQSLLEFKRLGLHLPAETQEKLRILKKEIAQHEIAFGKNIAEANGTIEVSKEELAGLSDGFIAALNKSDDGKYILGVDYPTFNHVMENCSVESTRKALWLKFMTRAYPDNVKELNAIIALRDQMAKLLGYESYAALDIDGQTAHDVETVEKFLADLTHRSKIKEKQEFDVLTKILPAGVTLTADTKIKPWDLLYLKNQYKQSHLQVNEIEISEYFPLESTVSALFDIYQKFFGLKFEKVAIPGLWHEDVQPLAVFKDDTFIGYILLDLFPRENKYSHACEITAISTVQQGSEFYPALILVIANFPKPTKDKPALLTRSDVITFFHEFGHAIHAILGATQLTSNSGTNVKRDFVELPSQMLEEWMWQPEFLKQVSKHYKTGEPLSDELIEKILQIKNYNSGEQTLKQLFYASIALELFKSGEKKDVHAIAKKLFDKLTTNVAYCDDNCFYAAFGHLTGYGAKYYGYLWSKVYALDLFDTIKQHGFSPQIGQKYIDTVLSKGGSNDPMELLEEFLGRKPQADAFFKDLGLENN